jgi:hypothetical protein
MGDKGGKEPSISLYLLNSLHTIIAQNYKKCAENFAGKKIFSIFADNM